MPALLDIIRKSPAWGPNLLVSRRCYQTSQKKKNTLNLSIFQRLITPLRRLSRLKQFSKFHGFLMHLYILDSPKKHKLNESGCVFFLGGGRVERANSRRYVVDCARWGRGVICVAKCKRVPSLWQSVNHPLKNPDYAYGEHSCKKTPRLSCFVWVGSSISSKVATNVTALLLSTLPYVVRS